MGDKGNRMGEEAGAGGELRRLAELRLWETATKDVAFLSIDEAKGVLHELGVHQFELELQNEELRRAQLALDASRARYFDLYDLAPVGYVSIGEAGLILEANLRFSVLVGIPRAELIDHPLTRYICADDQDIFYRRKRKLFATGERQSCDLRMKRADGTTFWARIEATRASVEDGEAAYCRLTATDISEQRATEQALAATNRLASMGLLAAGLAHEINNPLTAVLYNIETLAQRLPPLAGVVTRVCQALEQALGVDALGRVAGAGAELLREPELTHLAGLATQATAAAQRIHEIMKGLTSFSRPLEETLSPVDVNVAVQQAIRIVANEIKYRAEVSCDLGPVPPVLASPGMLSQVLVNLLVNAAQATPFGNREGHRISLRTWFEDKRVVVEVTDTGCGIRASDVSSVFEPFFTTKSAQRGTGLGLAISRKIITELGGTIDLESKVNQGTRVIFELPACQEAPQAAPLPATAEKAPSSAPQGRILVVDDEEMVRFVITGILELEHELVSAGSGREARELLARDQRFDLILCDLMMTDLSGIELHAWLVESHPELAARVAFITGGVFAPTSQCYLSALPNLVIQKPFKAAALRQHVREQIAGLGQRTIPTGAQGE